MGHLLKLKYALGTLECASLASTSVPFRPTTVLMPKLALIETKRITVYLNIYRGLQVMYLNINGWNECT
jgi:hypothetical protein